MKVVHLVRRPVSEPTVAANVLLHGVSGISIDASRVASPGETIQTHSRSAEASKKENRPVYGEYGPLETSQTEGQKLGRFPTNLLLLTHAPGCRCVGTKQIKGSHHGTGVWGKATGEAVYGDGWHDANQRRATYTDRAGMETVAAWECAADCPVRALDAQSGVSGSNWRASKGVGLGDGVVYGSWDGRESSARGHVDKGGASRFYSQFHRESGMRELPQDLINYLHTMITPTKVQLGGDDDGETLVAMDLSQVQWSEYGEEQLHGMITQGDPTPWMEEVWRVLKPGAHIMLVAPPEQPTGHTGACALEDHGFEIRDALLVVEQPGRIHYVPKAGKKERHTGVVGQNTHPTVKPKELLKRLLAGVSEHQTVVDPFMGSGSMALACLEAGVSYVGIEKEAEFVTIADQRVRHWDAALSGWSRAEVVSEAAAVKSEAAEQLDELFGF